MAAINAACHEPVAPDPLITPTPIDIPSEFKHIDYKNTSPNGAIEGLITAYTVHHGEKIVPDYVSYEDLYRNSEDRRRILHKDEYSFFYNVRAGGENDGILYAVAMRHQTFPPYSRTAAEIYTNIIRLWKSPPPDIAGLIAAQNGRRYIPPERLKDALAFVYTLPKDYPSIYDFRWKFNKATQLNDADTIDGEFKNVRISADTAGDLTLKIKEA